jgi:hypothetical protein
MESDQTFFRFDNDVLAAATQQTPRPLSRERP